MTPSPEHIARLVDKYAAIYKFDSDHLMPKEYARSVMQKFVDELLDDPAEAPVGQVREFVSPQGRVFVAVKSDSGPTGRWVIIGGNELGAMSYRDHDQVVGWPVVGSVPHTPAADQ